MSCPHCAEQAKKLEALQIKVETLQECLRGEERFVNDRRRFGLTRQEALLVGALFTRERVSKEGLFIVLYGDYNCDVDIKIVDVLVAKVRPKLKAIGIEIETLWGEGYRISREQRQQLRTLMSGAA